MSEKSQFDADLRKMFTLFTERTNDLKSYDEMTGYLCLSFEITKRLWKPFGKEFPHHVEGGRVDDQANICKFFVTARVLEYIYKKYQILELNSPALFRDLDTIRDTHIDAFSWIDSRLLGAIRGMYSMPQRVAELALRLGFAIPTGAGVQYSQSGELHEQLCLFFEGSKLDVADSLKRMDPQSVTRNFRNHNKALKTFWQAEFTYVQERHPQEKKSLSNVELTRAAFAKMELLPSPIPRSIWLGAVNQKPS